MSVSWGNNITVTNVTLVNTDSAAGTTDVQFDLRWENSWRSSWGELGIGVITNWDAAWVFVKYRQIGGDWHHAWLNASGHRAPAGSTIEVGSNGGATNMGAFIYRSAEEYGTLALTNVRLQWNYAANGVPYTNQIDVSVHAIEMVYVAQGPYYAGSTNGTESGHFHDGISFNMPFLVQTAGQISVSNQPNCLWGTSSSGDTTIGPEGVLSNAFPKGYAAFYCMKYEITQGQYRDFLNTLTRVQQNTRTASRAADQFTMSGNAAIQYRNGLRCPPTIPAEPETIVFGCDGNSNKIFDEPDDAMDRACNYLTWADVAAYADWVGLRPMTELEFEKACRGPLSPVKDEYAWGSTDIVTQTNHVAEGGADGSGTETALPANANCCYNSKMGAGVLAGPVRVGIYANAGNMRVAAGASYWGIMELGGNILERPVSMGNTDGRRFQGTHGDGALSDTGECANTDWPSPSTASGVGGRGGSFGSAGTYVRASDRGNAAALVPGRSIYNGGRAVRSASSDVGP